MIEHRVVLEDNIRRLMRALGHFDVAGEITATLAPREGLGGPHPPRYEIESFGCGDVADPALDASLAAHLASCAACRADVAVFRALLPVRTTRPAPDETSPDQIVPFALTLPQAYRVLFTMPDMAAAAGGVVRQRSAADATLRLLPVSEFPGWVIVAIQLKNPLLRPQLLRLRPPAGFPIEEHLPPPDARGLIQIVKDAARLNDRRFLELVLDVPLDFLDILEA
jgi:hypothetical protein